MRVLRSNVAPGMVLETGAMDRSGRMLIGAKTVLTGRLLDILDTAKIPLVYVTDISYEAHKTSPDLLPLSRKQEREINSRFRHVDLEGSFARALFDECLNHARECNVEDGGEVE